MKKRVYWCYSAYFASYYSGCIFKQGKEIFEFVCSVVNLDTAVKYPFLFISYHYNNFG